MNNIVTINNFNYELITNVKDAFIQDDVAAKFTDYFESYDYIVGDWAYNKLRLKGFNSGEQANSINNINNLDKYLASNCAYQCKYFVLKKKN